MVAGHMTKKNGYWYLILMVRDETGRLKQKWISTHLRVEGNKKKAEAMLLVNCTPFVRQYDILSNKWGVLLCQKEYQTNDIRRSSREWL